MSNRTREIVDFVHMEPLLVDEIEAMIQQCDEEEIDHLEQCGKVLVEATARLLGREPEFTKWR
jgi:hypothetical protein